MKQAVLVFILICLSGLSVAQDSMAIKFRFRESIELKMPVTERMTFCLFRNTFYYCKKRVTTKVGEKGQFKIYSYDLGSRKSDSFLLSIPYTKTLFSYSVSSVSVDDNTIVVSSDSLYVFDAKKRLLLRIADNHNSDNALPVGGDKVLLLKNYNSHPLDDSVKTKLMLYNFTKDKVEIYRKPWFNYFLYTHFVGNYFSSSDEVVAFAQAAPYKIRIYSKANLSIIDSITTGNLSNSSTTITKLDSIHSDYLNYLNPKKSFYELKVIDTFVRRIEKIQFLNNDVLLVSKRYLNSNFDRRTLDVWSHASGSWRQVVSDQEYWTEKPETDSFMITPESLPLNFTYSDKLLARNNEIIVLNQQVAPRMNTLNNQRKKYQDEYYATHELNYFLWLYTWDLKPR